MWSRDLPSETSQKFVALFRETYEREPNEEAALVYDAAGLLVHAMTSQGKTDPESIREGLANTKGYNGVTGTISYQGTGDPVKSVVISQIKDGQFVLYRQVNP